MAQRLQLQQLEQYFQPSEQRAGQGVYFCRILSWNEMVDAFLVRYYQAARACGAAVEGKLANPTEQNLRYYREILGDDFVLRPAFFAQQLSRWLPRLDRTRQKLVADGLYDVLLAMARQGKTDGMLRNAYIKFMCWLYYRFERLLQQFGQPQPPKLLYEGSISAYELDLLRILSAAGCDIVLVDCAGDDAYRRQDAASQYSQGYTAPDGKPFPPNYRIRQQVERAQLVQRAIGTSKIEQELKPCVNAWCSGDLWRDIQKPPSQRGTETDFYYTMFGRIVGVSDKSSYVSDLLQLYLSLTAANRPVTVWDAPLPKPTPDEISRVRRRSYRDQLEAVADLAQNICCAQPALQFVLRQQFLTFFQAEPAPEGKWNRLLNRMVYVLCWLARYQKELFGTWPDGEQGTLLILRDGRDEQETLFWRYLARLPLDILIFSPNGKLCGEIKDKLLYEKKYTLSMEVERYPTEGTVRVGTVAYHAEQELTETLYQDSGLYREQQYQKARVVALQTMYEEIAILWEQEEAYRPNFQIVGDEVLMPVIFARICGVKDSNVSAYWKDIKKLAANKDTQLYTQAPIRRREDANPIRQYATEFFRSGKLQRDYLKRHKCYPYAYLREEMQDYMLDKLQQLIDLQLIAGTMQQGVVYTIIAVALHLDKDIVRLIQKMDFTKTAPKLLLVHTGEGSYSLEDGILAAYLHLLGFDVVCFQPTGYRGVEQYYTQPVMTEHIIGEYLYDLRVPGNLRDNRLSWRDWFTGKGR